MCLLLSLVWFSYPNTRHAVLCCIHQLRNYLEFFLPTFKRLLLFLSLCHLKAFYGLNAYKQNERLPFLVRATLPKVHRSKSALNKTKQSERERNTVSEISFFPSLICSVTAQTSTAKWTHDFQRIKRVVCNLYFPSSASLPFDIYIHFLLVLNRVY